MLTYLLLPDFGDVGGAYLLFRLIKNDTVANLMMYVAPVLFVANVAILILECIELRKGKSR